LKAAVLITTGQPSINPRIVKEANALCAAGFSVTVLYCYWIQWAHEADANVLKNVEWDYRLIGGTPCQSKATYFYTKVRTKVNSILNRHFGCKLLFAERSQARCYDELLKAAKSIAAHWYIGHNLGALAIAVKAAAHYGASVGFDFEDYHREENENMILHETKRIVYLEEKYVPRLSYISTSSLLISKKVEDNFPGFKKPIITIINCFSLKQQPCFRVGEAGEPLKLFWFSQTIGKNRGLEVLIEALHILNDKSIQLTLAGRCNADMYSYIMGYNSTIHCSFAGIIDPDFLPAEAAKHDVGLALELTSPENRNLCLTNKILTYLLAGNAVIFSDTSMQRLFNEEYQAGEIFKQDDCSMLVDKIRVYKDGNFLSSQRVHNYNLASTSLNWERESKNLLEVLR
jgi:hypothetical protein